jgi:sugar/nucleoside kinase (ribokinase family)
VPAPALLLLGQLQRDTVITADGRARIDQAGGNLLYAAAACRLWGENPSLVTRVGSDFPAEWLQALADRGLDTQGIRVLDQAQDLRRFIAYTDPFAPRYDNPIKHFGKWGLPLPKALLSYRDPRQLDSKKERSPLALRRSDLPSAYLGARAAHLCPLDFFSHSLMPAALRELGVAQITLEAAPGYMHSAFWNQLANLVNGLSAFVVEEALLRALFTGRGEDLWAMIEAIAAYNCAAVLVRSAARGFWLYEAANHKRTHLPPYPARSYDITDTGSSFCGAFATELARNQDWERAMLVGAATASLAVEGSGAFYVMETLPDLAKSRAQLLEGALKNV